MSADTPVYTLYAPDEDEKTNIDPVVNLEGEAYLKSLERLGGDFTDNESGTNGDGSGSGGNYYIDPDDYENSGDYAKELMKELYYHYEAGNDDTFLIQNGYEAGDEGKKALIDYVQDTLGVEGVVEYWDQIRGGEVKSEDNGHHVITAPEDVTGFEGGGNEVDATQGVHFSGSYSGFPDTGGGGGGMLGGSWGEKEQGITATEFIDRLGEMEEKLQLSQELVESYSFF